MKSYTVCPSYCTLVIMVNLRKKTVMLICNVALDTAEKKMLTAVGGMSLFYCGTLPNNRA